MSANWNIFEFLNQIWMDMQPSNAGIYAGRPINRSELEAFGRPDLVGFSQPVQYPGGDRLIRGMNGAEPYWRRVLECCAAGCLQSVLDEYVHMLIESEGLIETPTINASAQLADRIASVQGYGRLRPASTG